MPLPNPHSSPLYWASTAAAHIEPVLARCWLPEPCETHDSREGLVLTTHEGGDVQHMLCMQCLLDHFKLFSIHMVSQPRPEPDHSQNLAEQQRLLREYQQIKAQNQRRGFQGSPSYGTTDETTTTGGYVITTTAPTPDSKSLWKQLQDVLK